MGVPVTRANGAFFGTLCGVDRTTHRRSATQIAALRVLARLVAFHLEHEEHVRLEGALLAARTAAREAGDRLMGVTMPLGPLAGNPNLPRSIRDRAREAMVAAQDTAEFLNRLRGITHIEEQEMGALPPSIDVERSG